MHYPSSSFCNSIPQDLLIPRMAEFHLNTTQGHFGLFHHGLLDGRRGQSGQGFSMEAEGTALRLSSWDLNFCFIGPILFSQILCASFSSRRSTNFCFYTWLPNFKQINLLDLNKWLQNCGQNPRKKILKGAKSNQSGKCDNLDEAVPSAINSSNHPAKRLKPTQHGWREFKNFIYPKQAIKCWKR